MQANVQKRSHPFRWFLAFVAIVELLVLAAIVLFVSLARPCMSATAAQYVGRLGGGSGAGLGAGASITGTLPGATAPEIAVSPAASDTPSIVTPAPAQPSAQAGGDSSGGETKPMSAASGSLNDVPDPNCVGKSAAALLTADKATAPPSCGPLNAPPALKDAANQVQHLGEPAPAAR